ncbi:ABC transporter ATP-binding protein [candidate division KSB1 bacterium]|nr:ABC transporter ATP-binding protein [candidate division KSB1 bacterium]
MTSFLSIANLILAYDKKPVVRDVTLDIKPGTVVGLIGPNGVGKTTFLLSISGQFRPRSGSIHFLDRDIYIDNYQYKKQIGYVHENPFFYAHMTAEDFLIFIARVKGMLRKDIEAQIDALLRAVRLHDERAKLTKHLSQGMRRKLAIAAAFIGSPKIIFLDEALNGVDIESAFQIKKLLLDFVKNGGAVVLSTHVMEVIEKLCDRYIIFKSGQIIADLSACEFEYVDLEQRVLTLLQG